MKKFLYIMMLILSGCAQGYDKDDVIAPKNTEIVGRFQMQSIKIGHGDEEQSAVMVIDTVNGRISQCRATLQNPECSIGAYPLP
jgi:hypothetical protein